MAISWSSIEPFVTRAHEIQGRVERADVIDLAYDANADDDTIDTIDAIGSRVFPDVAATKTFLQGQGLVTD